MDRRPVSFGPWAVAFDGRLAYITGMHTTTLTVNTPSRDAMINVTDAVRQAIAESNIADGLVNVYVPHTTAAVTINENADPDVIHDVLTQLDAMVPWREGFYRHGEGNSAAHVKSSMFGCSLVVPLIDGAMPLGTWQSIYFCEFDGPRTRKMIVSVTEG
jgi:secondary thiamine-phosphate synthase enzyme